MGDIRSLCGHSNFNLFPPLLLLVLPAAPTPAPGSSEVMLCSPRDTLAQHQIAGATFSNIFFQFGVSPPLLKSHRGDLEARFPPGPNPLSSFNQLRDALHLSHCALMVAGVPAFCWLRALSAAGKASVPHSHPKSSTTHPLPPSQPAPLQPSVQLGYICVSCVLSVFFFLTR